MLEVIIQKIDNLSDFIYNFISFTSEHYFSQYGINIKGLHKIKWFIFYFFVCEYSGLVFYLFYKGYCASWRVKRNLILSSCALCCIFIFLSITRYLPWILVVLCFNLVLVFVMPGESISQYYSRQRYIRRLKHYNLAKQYGIDHPFFNEEPKKPDDLIEELLAPSKISLLLKVAFWKIYSNLLVLIKYVKTKFFDRWSKFIDFLRKWKR